MKLNFILPFILAGLVYKLSTEILREPDPASQKDSYKTTADNAVIKADAHEMRLLNEIAQDSLVTDQELWRYGQENHLFGRLQTSQNFTIGTIKEIDPLYQRASSFSSLNQMAQKARTYGKERIVFIEDHDFETALYKTVDAKKVEEIVCLFQKTQKKLGLKNIQTYFLFDPEKSSGFSHQKLNIALNIYALNDRPEALNYVVAHECGHYRQFCYTAFADRVKKDSLFNTTFVEDDADRIAAELDPENVHGAFLDFLQCNDITEEQFYRSLDYERASYKENQDRQLYDPHSCSVDRVKNMILASARHQAALHLK